MRQLDTNIFLRYLAKPMSQEDRRKLQACASLFQRVQAGQEEVTTTEVVIAEVLYVLCARAHYNLSHQDAAARLRPMLSLTSLKIQHKRTYLRALDLFATHPFLDFEDAVIIAQMERQGVAELYSYDHDFDRIPGIARVEP